MLMFKRVAVTDRRRIGRARRNLRPRVETLVACPRQLCSGFRSAAPGMARRDDREYREYLSEEQRSQPGCPARKALYK